MPRLLPRLLRGLEPSKPPAAFTLDNIRFRGKSLRKPVPPLPSFHPSDYQRSLLLTPGNPITNSRDYIQHKSLPPRVKLPNRAKARKNTHDLPRVMTEEERRWWASPYLRMLSTPLRRCMQTQQSLPSAFLIRLGVFRTPSAKDQNFFNPNSAPEAILMPDGLEHPKFRGRKSGKAGYFLCWKDVIEPMSASGTFKRIAWNIRLPESSNLEAHIRHLLRLRVLQELRLVIDGLRYRPNTLAHKPLIRKLSRKEWKSIQSTGTMPVANAMAVIVVPPLNRHPETKERPRASMSSLPPPPEDPAVPPRQFQRPSLPLCTLHPIGAEPENLPDDVHLSHPRIPLYNGVSLFPNPEQRAALVALLNRILALEVSSRRKSRTVPADATSAEENQLSSNNSHAYVLMSDEDTALTADMAAVGVALWRIPLFEGMGWDEKNEWVKRYKYRSMFGNDKYEI